MAHTCDHIWKHCFTKRMVVPSYRTRLRSLRKRLLTKKLFVDSMAYKLA
jgi:hypothetical protein